MSASQHSVVIDFNAFKRRRRARAEPAAANPAGAPILWCPVIVMMPVWCWYVPQQDLNRVPSQ